MLARGAKAGRERERVGNYSLERVAAAIEASASTNAPHSHRTATRCHKFWASLRIALYLGQLLFLATFRGMPRKVAKNRCTSSGPLF